MKKCTSQLVDSRNSSQVKYLTCELSFVCGFGLVWWSVVAGLVVGWLVCVYTGWFVGVMVGRFTGVLPVCLVGYMACWLACCMPGWVAGWSDGGCILLTRRVAGWLACLPAGLIVD